MLGESFRQTVCCGSARSHRKIASPPPPPLSEKGRVISLPPLPSPPFPPFAPESPQGGRGEKRELACERTYSLLKEKPVKFSAFSPLCLVNSTPARDDLVWNADACLRGFCSKALKSIIATVSQMFIRLFFEGKNLLAAARKVWFFKRKRLFSLDITSTYGGETDSRRRVCLFLETTTIFCCTVQLWH